MLTETMSAEMLQLNVAISDTAVRRPAPTGAAQLPGPDGAAPLTSRPLPRAVYFLIAKLLALANSIAEV